MKYSDYKEQFKHCCHFCEFRHGTCSWSEEHILETYNTGKCPDFIIGKCYVCAIKQAMTDEEYGSVGVCDEAFYPDGCDSFKPGNFYREWHKELRDIVECRWHGESTAFPSKRSFGSLRRKRRAMVKERRRLLRMAQNSGYPCGAYTVDKDGHWCEADSPEAVRLKRDYRGKRSGWIKKYCNRRFRRSSKFRQVSGRQRGTYRKCTEFWWEYW